MAAKPLPDPEGMLRLEQAIRAGATGEVAAQTIGVVRSTYYVWLEKGRDAPEGTPYREFHDRVQRARAESEVGLVARIAQAAGNGSWGAAAWLLERRFPERWGKATAEAAKSEPTAAESEKAFAEVISLAKRRPR